MRYYLERVKGVPQGSAWALVGGTAFHETIREWETHAALYGGTAGTMDPDTAAERFAHHLAEATSAEIIARGVPLKEWRASGRSSTQYPNKEDRSWWLDHGPEMVAKYVVAQEGRECEVLRLGDAGDALALELGFTWRPGEPDLPPIDGFIDQVLYFPRTDSIIVRDLKSGAQVPRDHLQVKLYRLAVEQAYGITATKWWGDYWDARKGEATKGVDLTDRDRVEREVRYRVRAMDTAETLGLYPPNPGNNCSACTVKPHCPAMSDEPFATWPRGAADTAPALDAPSAGA